MEDGGTMQEIMWVQIFWVLCIATAVVASVLAIWRPLTFASVDAEVAIARGVPVRALSLVFMLLLGLAVAIGGHGRLGSAPRPDRDLTSRWPS